MSFVQRHSLCFCETVVRSQITHGETKQNLVLMFVVCHNRYFSVSFIRQQIISINEIVTLVVKNYPVSRSSAELMEKLKKKLDDVDSLITEMERNAQSSDKSKQKVSRCHRCGV